MKRTWIAVLFLAIVLGAGIGWCGFIGKTVEQLRVQVQQTLQDMDSAPEQAGESLEKISEAWDEAEQKLDYIVMHDHIDEAKMALTKCRQYYAQQEYQMAQTELYLFSGILEEMAEKEQPTIENIF